MQYCRNVSKRLIILNDENIKDILDKIISGYLCQIITPPFFYQYIACISPSEGGFDLARFKIFLLSEIPNDGISLFIHGANLGAQPGDAYKFFA